MMEHKILPFKAPENGRSAKTNARSSNLKLSKAQVTPLLPRISGGETNSSGRLDHLRVTSGLVIALVAPALVLTGALDDVLGFGVLILGYVVSGSLGGLLYWSASRVTRTTSVVPGASDRRLTKLRKVA